MATEGPLIHDGAQCTAAANYYNPSSALDGPNGSGQFLFVYVSAARVVTVQTSSGGAVYGILQNTPASGQAADVGIMGISKVVAGAAITAGANLMCDTAGRPDHYGGHHSGDESDLTPSCPLGLGQADSSAARRHIPIDGASRCPSQPFSRSMYRPR